MIRIINGVMYDTRKADALDVWFDEKGMFHVDHTWDNYICETLCRNKDGEFFLLGEGGKNTKYWDDKRADIGLGLVANTTQKIVPLTYQQAWFWAISKSNIIKAFSKRWFGVEEVASK